ncbi:hypothetical protein [Candidatus Poriferisodalis sp.]|uniref:hypothetical protein n=1 Tax=Candidatus Poriferisodalis sp. TaxID=3101277 RepID=UPI003C6F360D
MDQSPLVLLCAASGTGLSAIARGLSDSDENSDAEAGKVEALRDLETSLCESYKGDARIVNHGDTVPSMGSVVTLPRDELYQTWNSTCDRLMDKHANSKKADLRVLSLHLTWFDSNTGEFFSPVDVRHLDREGCKFDHVVILIDDIFDMYSRLQNPGGLYSQSVIDNKASLIAGLRGLNLGSLDASSNPPDDDDAVRQNKLAARRLRLEAKELALGHLMSWRRSEMIYAENIARILGANFTILGTKHSKTALWHLAKSSEIPRTYLSHRISEVRRLNKKSSSLPEELGEWGSVVGEVNDLHFAFSRGKQLLINPTAIDELRFATIDQHKSDEEQAQPSLNGEGASGCDGHDSGPVDYGGRESALLAARWELPKSQSELLWVSKIELPDGSIGNLSPEHTEIFTEDLSPIDDIALSVTRSLESRIFEEVSFRDHIIVENTPHLFVYRPFYHPNRSSDATRVEWSGGVGPEVDHWTKKFKFTSEASARVAFVHTRSEVAARIAWLESMGTEAPFLDHADSMLRSLFKKWHVSDEESFGFFRGRLVKRTPKGLAQNPSSILLEEPDTVLGWIRAAALLGLTEAFTRLKLRSSDEAESSDPERVSVPLDALGLFAIEEGDKGVAQNPEDNAQKLCAFFKGALSAEDLYREFWAVHDAEFLRIVGESPAEYVAHKLNYPYDELLNTSLAKQT